MKKNLLKCKYKHQIILRVLILQALIGWQTGNSPPKFQCAGSWIGENVILTGGHCTHRDNVSPTTVRLGHGQNNEDFKIVNITTHYRYKKHLDYHNMAILEIDRVPNRAKFSPACIWTKENIAYSSVFLIGRFKNDFRETKLSILNTEKCHEYYDPTPELRFGILVCCFCAKNENESFCTDEPSSPIQIYLKDKNKHTVPFLIGHKSIGKSCNTVVPGVYTRYSNYADWIETVSGIDFANHMGKHEIIKGQLDRGLMYILF
jgi:hypothetical protein